MSPMTKRETDSDYPQPEAEKRRDDLLKRLLHTPPKPRPQRERDAGEKPTRGRGKSGVEKPGGR